SNGFIADTLSAVSLNVSWGADGYGDLAFTTGAGASGLTSNGQAINYYLSADGTELTARAGGASARIVFKVTLDPQANDGRGGYTFELRDNIDHAANSDLTPLTFGFKA